MTQSKTVGGAAKKTAKNSAPLKGEKVRWNYGAGKATGKVLEVYRKPVTKTLKGATITRKASPDKPAALVRSDNGGEALKSGSELKAVRKRRVVNGKSD